MKRAMGIAGLLLAVLVGSGALGGGERMGIKYFPPVVVKTEPMSGDTEVDPALGEIKITFSKDMKTEKSWSFIQVSKDSFPKLGEPKFLDKRTVVVPVTLEPGKTYILWLNNQKFTGFRDLENYSAVPYLLAFETRK